MSVRKESPAAGRTNMRIRWAVATALLSSASPGTHAAPPQPKLPTPCIGTPCGTNTSNVSFVTAGQASAVVSGNKLSVTQTTNTAILNWRDFNIASGSSVNFIQPNSSASALNRIWSADPSKISGKLTANGQIYLLNQNGIIFAKGAQVDVGSLTATTLNITDQAYLRGLLSGNTATYTSGGILPPVFQAPEGTTPGAVTVAPGAQIQTADGGRVLLLGSTVTNGGKIATPDGQTILAAGTTAYLASTTDPNLRGLLIAVDSQELAANSTVSNTGQITAQRGNITLAGLVVNQAGTVSATTSVNANGSIYLVAGDADTNAYPSFYSGSKNGFAQGQLLPTVGGTLTLAPGSVTEVTADATSKTTITNAQTFYTSQVELVGKTIELQGNASIVAHGGTVDLNAFANPFVGVANQNDHRLSAEPDGARVYLDTASSIDVSGLRNVSAPASENLVQIQLGANELQDDPLLRDGFLHGQTVTVDVTRGTPLLNAATLQSYANTIARPIDEKLTTAGTINLTSGGDVIARAGSTLNVSGGSVAFQSAPGQTSKLIGSNGQVYDIGSAPTNIQYTGFADSYSYIDPRWGTKTTFSSAGQVAGFLQGAAAGSLSVKGADLYLAGTMLGTTIPGPYQRSAAAVPKGGRLVIGDAAATVNPATSLTNFAAPSLTLVGSVQDLLGNFDPATSILTPAGSVAVGVGDLAANGFNQLGLYSNGTIDLPSSAHLQLAGSGSLTLEAGAVTLEGSVRAPGSRVQVLTALQLAGQPPADSNILLAKGASVDVSGTWVNDSPAVSSQLGTAPTLYNGGSISLVAAPQSDVLLQAGSLLNVSGGGWVDSNNKLTAGTAGSITLRGGGVVPGQTGIANGGVLLDGELRGASLTSGGSLAITSAWATVGAPSQGRPGEIAYTPEFFTQGGFRNYSITGIDGVTIGSSYPKQTVTIAPVQQNLVFNGAYLLQPTGTDLGSFTTLQTRPQQYRGAASVSFSSTLSSFLTPGAGNLTFNEGASILTDPGATVTLAARENMSVLGKITAPAGTINLLLAPGVTAATSTDNDGYIADQALLIGSTARLNAQGYAAVYTDNPQGYRQGQVLSGGTINVSANKGSVIAQSGAVLDVSGAAATVDLTPRGGSAVPSTVAGAAGTIHVAALENIVLNSTLLGKAAAVPGAAGGTLLLGFNLFDLHAAEQFNSTATVPLYPTVDRNLIITSQTGLSNALPVDGNGVIVDGIARVSTSTLNGGGFDTLRLASSDLITLDGTPVLAPRASLALSALQLQATAGTRANLSSAYVSLGDATYYPSGTGESGRQYVPSAGDGTLAVKAGLIDMVGNSSVSGFQSVQLASSGDIRLGYAVDANELTDFSGSLRTAADLTLSAQQVYPITRANFTINPADLGTDPTLLASYSYTPGAVTSVPASGGVPQLPLSAQGALTINSTTINQYGVLRAPFGAITFNGVGEQGTVVLHAGSTTSVSGAGALVPYGSTQNGRQWTYLQSTSGSGTQGSTTLINTLGPKQVQTKGSNVVIDSGAKVDVSGGGDLYAYEFIAGTGGSQDVLAGTGNYSYAILPDLASPFAPLDHQYAAGTHIPIGKEIYLSGVPGLADGYYALLPPRYALLPGAFAVQVVAPGSDIIPGTAVSEPGGSYLVAGRYSQAGTSVVDGRTSAFLLTPAAVVRTQSEYSDSYANVFFNNAALTAGTVPVNLPADAGQLTLGASSNLSIAGTINFAPGQFVAGRDGQGHDIVQTGTGGIAAIVAAQIEVTSGATAPDGALQVTADALNQLGASTIILGASRTASAAGNNLEVGASSVLINNTAADALTAPEILVAATQNVTLSAGSALKATGGSDSGAVPSLFVTGDGALLRVSSGAQSTLVRGASSGLGDLVVSAGATVTGNSLILDAAGSTQVATGASIHAHAVEASSSRINLGDVPAGSPGLNITAQLLDTFGGLTDLSLRSSSTIDFYGAVGLGGQGSGGAATLSSLTLDAAGIGGYGSEAKTLEAGRITLTNSGPAGSFLSTPDGTGKLSLHALGSTATAPQIMLGPGAKAVQGFGGVQLTAAGGEVRGVQHGSLVLTNAGLLDIESSRISTDAAAVQTITNGSGAIRIGGAGRPSSLLGDAGLGGTLAMNATAPQGHDAITVGGSVLLPSGNVLLHAQGGGDLTVSSGGSISTAGVVKPYFDTFAVSPGGSVLLAADAGSVTLLQGAIVDVTGASTADGKVGSAAGSLAVLVPQGQFNLAGVISGGAAAGQQAGSFTLDTAGNADHAVPFKVSALNLGASGFEGAVSIRDRGDTAVVVDGTSRARAWQLSVDQGSITVTGTVDTHGLAGQGGGNIALWAGADLTLASGALLNASAGSAVNAHSARGGNVTLDSVGGELTLAHGAGIDIRGSTGTDNPGVSPDGHLLLGASYRATSGTLAVAPIAATIRSTSAPTVVVDAQWQYAGVTLLDPGGDLTPQTIANDVQAFAGNAPGIAAALVPAGSNFSVQLRPSVSVLGASDLTVGSTLDLRALAAAAPGGAPIDLTLRAPGNLILNGSLSDGFTAAGTDVTAWPLAGGDSSSYHLTAGADLSAANPRATVRGIGNFILAPGALVRTGTGNIAIAAGNRVCLGCLPDGTVSSEATAKGSVVYTAGVPSGNAPAFFTAPTVAAEHVPAGFPVGGGDISIDAGGDIVSAPTTNLVSNWLWRQGAVRTDGSATQDTAWWVETDSFAQGIGALGGGNIDLRAGGNIVDVSAVIASNGRVGHASAQDPTLSAGTLVRNGGGNLMVSAGGSLLGGLFADDLGSASIRVGGAVSNSATRGFAPVLVMGDSNFSLSAGSGVDIGAVFNSTMLPEALANKNNVSSAEGTNVNAYFFTYAPTSAFNIVSSGGSITLDNNLTQIVAAASHGDPLDTSSITSSVFYPSEVQLASLSADVKVQGSALVGFPSPQGNLTVLAQDSIHIGTGMSLSEVDPALIHAILTPVLASRADLALVGQPATPLHAQDAEPARLVAATGDIIQTTASQVILPKAADFVAGGDILNLNYSGKNLAADDVTLFQAGGNISYDTARNPDSNQLTANPTGIQVGGAGFVEAIAGGSIDLGDSSGVVTRGRLGDPRLPSTGATLVVAAGLGHNADGSLRQPSYDAFITKYLTAGSSGTPGAYADDLVDYVASLNPGGTPPTAAQALAQFTILPRNLQLPFISQVLTDELSATGLDHTQNGASYTRGYTAINTLFPQRDAQGNPIVYKGDINLFFSQLKTEQGGDIDLLAPGGAIVVGVPNPPAELTDVKGQPLLLPPISAEANLGVLVLAQGAIQGFANNNFDVNQARMLTLQGGDIILWSSFGSIDAGKGAKTAQGAPPPVIETDPNGNVFVNPIGAVSGSGIGQLLTISGIKAGLVNLIAPVGVVNAGEAGIRVAGNLNIAATAVLNVGNIKVGGTSTGVPTSDAGALSGALSGANAVSDVGKQVVDQLNQNLNSANNFQQLTDSLAPSFIVVRMFCLGVQCESQ